MTPLPKRRISRTRRDKRRTHHALGKTALVICDNCGNKKQPHTMCTICRTYNKRQILPEVADE